MGHFLVGEFLWGQFFWGNFPGGIFPEASFRGLFQEPEIIHDLLLCFSV